MTIRVSGMSCEHCLKRVKKALEAIPGVKNVKIDLSSGKTTFEAPEDLPREEIARAISKAGYQLVD
ncbi:heavy-metal-associated domain-containing protein [Thermosulfuriphilus sp.]